MERREIKKIRYFIVFIITSLVFLIGIWMGQLLSDYNFKGIEDAQRDLRIQTATLETQYLLIAQNPCLLLDSNKLDEELYEMGGRLRHMEDRYGNDNEDVAKLKEYYSLLELRHWIFLGQIKDKCKKNDFTNILYFYSNLGDCKICGEQGYVLTYLREKDPTLRIYSFDINLENSALDWIKESYRIEKTPTLIINGIKYDGFFNEDQLNEIIK